MNKYIFVLLIFLSNQTLRAENGYDLWMRYKPLDKSEKTYINFNAYASHLCILGQSPTLEVSTNELNIALEKMFGFRPKKVDQLLASTLLVGTSKQIIAAGVQLGETKALGDEGYMIREILAGKNKFLVITANTDIGVLYGVFGFLRLLQSGDTLPVNGLVEIPRLQRRVLNHWDNLNGTVERGYAGSSIWDWQRLPGYLDKRYTDYARANASIGINGTVLNNVNASAKSLSAEYLQKTAALADLFRPYGIRIYLTARFSAPIEIGGLKTADPINPEVIEWWKKKADEIYQLIPDFGGFLVKANSEGQPGPQDYKRTHAQGANMMADALAPHGGIVMWRAFVYENIKGEDRAKQAYQEFKKLDGAFKTNVFLQPKNGPIDFQPREPFHPIFGAMSKTQLMPEFQLTQEYLGFATHLVYLAPLIKETLKEDTYAMGKGSTISKIIQDQTEGKNLTGMAGVANIGSDINWTGHLFAQSNWFAFGRLAWNPENSSGQIAEEWVKMTFGQSPIVVNAICNFMLSSRETTVKYMMPLGLNHIMNLGTHYGPGPWDKITGWNAHDYHMADSVGLGVDRTESGTNAIEQYFPEVRKKLGNLQACPPELLLWFHHVSWEYKMPSGRKFWDELLFEYDEGIARVKDMQQSWSNLKGHIDEERFNHVKQLIEEQLREAYWWRDGSVLYFQQYAKMPWPSGFDIPPFELKHYINLPFPDRVRKSR